MRLKRGLVIIGSSLLITVGFLLIVHGQIPAHAEGSYQDITVIMYPLRGDGSRDTSQQEKPLCQPDDPSTPQNEADTRYGCTAFDQDHYPPHQVVPYPYATNPATVSIEDDYLLDVVAREMGPYYHPLALRAQAIAARTYTYCTIRANEGTEDFWGNCRKEINNSNAFQVFVPGYFEFIDSPPVIQDAVNETRGLYLICRMRGCGKRRSDCW